MKANAPEKLWWSEGAVWHTNPNSIRYVEYTRVDAFIEKACEFLFENYHGEKLSLRMIEDFEEYLKK